MMMARYAHYDHLLRNAPIRLGVEVDGLQECGWLAHVDGWRTA